MRRYLSKAMPGHNLYKNLSGVFNAAAYRRRHSDVAQARIEPFLHFQSHGFSEGREVSRLLDVAYCKNVAHRQGQPIRDLRDLDQFVEQIGPDSHHSTSPFFCPSWVLRQLPNARRIKTFSSLLNVKLGNKPISLHPALGYVDYTAATVGEAVEAIDDQVLARLSWLEVDLYKRHHKDIREKNFSETQVFQHLWTYGIYENRLKFLKTSAPQWATYEQLLVDNFAALARVRLSNRVHSAQAPIVRPFGAGAEDSLRVIEPNEAQMLAEIEKFRLSKDAAIPGWDELLNVHRLAASPGSLIVRDTPRVPSILVRSEEITDVDLVSQRVGVQAQRVLYSANLGGYDVINPPPKLAESTNYLITDAPSSLVPSEWTIVRPTVKERDLKRVCLWYKTHPHLLFPKIKSVTWVDGNIRFSEQSCNTIYAQEAIAEIATFRHPDRNCVYDELEVIRRLRLDADPTISRLEAFYKAEKMPEQWGLFETNVLFSRPTDMAVIEFFDLWWRMIFLYSRRDQASFSYAVWKTGIDVGLLDGSRSARNSRSFEKIPHHPQLRGRFI